MTSQAIGTIQNDDQQSGNIDGDGDFDANDSFLIQLVLLGGTDAQIDQAKGSSPRTAAEIRAAITAAIQSGKFDVDGNGKTDANDAFLINLIKLAGTNAQVDQAKGASPLSAAEIRSRVDSLSGGGGPASVNLTGNLKLQNSKSLFDTATQTPSPQVAAAHAAYPELVDHLWTSSRSWLDTL